MKLFSFKRSVDIKEIGCFPQCEIANFENPNSAPSIHSIKSKSFPVHHPDVELKMRENAKVTDIMYASILPSGFLVSHRVKNILENSRLPAHRFFDTKIHGVNPDTPYYWFYFISNEFWNWIDTDNSIIHLRSRIPEKRQKILETVDLSLEAELIATLSKKLPNLTKFYWEKLTLNSEFPDLDIFQFYYPTLETLVSIQLTNDFEKNDVTGYQIKPLEAIIS